MVVRSAKKASPGQLGLDIPGTGTASEVQVPDGYTGLARFHKYWGKKPAEISTFLTQALTEPGDLVLDPFVGSGVSALPVVMAGRRLLAVDLNPTAAELTRMLLSPPSPRSLDEALLHLGRSVAEPIRESYRLVDGRNATHYLWNGDSLQAVWVVNGRKREEFVPTEHDTSLARSFASCQASTLRPLQLFDNARINATTAIGWSDLFTGRALSNIDLIVEQLRVAPEETRVPLLLVLTSCIGQMSNMVFAISGRGKTRGAAAPDKIEVGSWVIGYWRPELHFEVNVWQVFERRLKRLAKTLRSVPAVDLHRHGDIGSLVRATSGYLVLNADSLEVLSGIPADSVSLIVTDPPHGDRIPYCELSEIWNAVLDESPDFSAEVVVSNARGRNKDSSSYNASISQFFQEAARVLKPRGFLGFMFNSRRPEDWLEIKTDAATTDGQLVYIGRFPAEYSANSVVQDNRSGAMKSDHVLIFQRCHLSGNAGAPPSLTCVPGWTEEPPA